MRQLNLDQMLDILNDAAELDEEIADMWTEFMQDEQFNAFAEFFDYKNFNHYDRDLEEFIDVDEETSHKRLKRILRGKDTVELIKFAFDFGRLVGRAEQVLHDAPTPAAGGD